MRKLKDFQSTSVNIGNVPFYSICCVLCLLCLIDDLEGNWLLGPKISIKCNVHNSIMLVCFSPSEGMTLLSFLSMLIVKELSWNLFINFCWKLPLNINDCRLWLICNLSITVLYVSYVEPWMNPWVSFMYTVQCALSESCTGWYWIQFTISFSYFYIRCWLNVWIWCRTGIMFYRVKD